MGSTIKVCVRQTTIFEEICCEIGLDYVKNKNLFQQAWEIFSQALKKKAIRTWSYEEAFLAWLLVLRFQPKYLLELGSQHGHSGLIWLDALKRTGGKLIAVELGQDPRNHYVGTSVGTMEFLPEEDENVIKIWGDAEEKLPGILLDYPVDFVFHDCAHTWDHVEKCVSIIEPFGIIQTCHDCAEGMWRPERETHYGIICAERPIFDQHFLHNNDYYYRIFEDRYGMGMSIPKDKI